LLLQLTDSSDEDPGQHHHHHHPSHRSRTDKNNNVKKRQQQQQQQQQEQSERGIPKSSLFLPTFAHNRRSKTPKADTTSATVTDDHEESTSKNTNNNTNNNEEYLNDLRCIRDEFNIKEEDNGTYYANHLNRTAASTTNRQQQTNDNDGDDTSVRSDNTRLDRHSPSLFLQEAAHLYSLMSAVAMASLRADLEGCASPLVEYIPGQPFPPVNPDEMKVKVWLSRPETDDDEEEEERDDQSKGPENELDKSNSGATVIKETKPTMSLPPRTNRKMWTRNSRFINSVYFLLGLSRSPRQRTLYNASRPFAVLGGLSDNEMEMLQKARGPEAQMALCALWLKEFISREHLAGSTAQISPPIVARVYQFISEGTSNYNQCRKVAYTPFPFPHAQLTSFFIFVSLFVFPYLYYTYVNSTVLACLLNFTTLACFDGMDEVARELQDPFYQFPNDLPLNNYQVQFNEALISSMFGGFHPDIKDEETTE
jgi:hypothetical protein